MITIYKVHNPYTGLYTDVDTIEELRSALAAEAWRAYTTLTHGQPFSVVTINADGSQVWRNPQGDDIPSAEEIQNIIQNNISNFATEEEVLKIINGE